MSLMLRCVKNFRFLSSSGRGLLSNTTQYENNNFPSLSFRNLAYQRIASQKNEASTNTIESNLKRIDFEVQRSGRVFRKDVDELLEELRQSNSTTSSQSLLMIRCCGDLVIDEHPDVKTKLVQEIWKTLEKINIKMDISHYNALLRVYIENDHDFDPLAFLDELSKNDVSPNRITYQRLIEKYCKAGDIDGATKILEFMKEKQIPINENVFNSLIVGHMQSGDVPSALGMLDVMKQAGVEPSADSYTVLLCGFAKVGDIDTINEMIATLNEKELFLSDKDYLEIVYYLGVHDFGEHVPAILSKVRKMIGYRQDATNTVLRLLLKDKYDVAYRVFETMGRIDTEDLQFGTFIIKQMVRLNKPVDKVLEMCRRLEADGYNNRTISRACESCLLFANYELALPLFDEYARLGNEVKSHFFWPFVVNRGRVNNFTGVLDVVRTMIERYKITPSLETLKNYVIPNLSTNTENVIKDLNEIGVSMSSIINSMFAFKLYELQMKEAFEVISKFSVSNIQISLIRRPLARCLLMTKNDQTFMDIVKLLLDKQTAVRSEDNLPVRDVAGLVLYDVVKTSKSNQSQNMAEKIMRLYAENGIKISNEMGEDIQKCMAANWKVEQCDFLSNLVDDNFENIVRTKIFTPRKHGSAMTAGADDGAATAVIDHNSIEKLEKELQEARDSPSEANKIIGTLIYQYCRLKGGKYNSKLKALVSDILRAELEFELNVSQLALLLQHFSTLEDVEMVDSLLTNFRQQNREISIDESKLIKCARLFVLNNHFDKAIDLLTNCKKHSKSEEDFLYRMDVWKMLNHLAVSGESEKLNELFDVLEKNEYFKVDNMFLSPLINVHMIKGDLKKAIEVFENCCSKYFLTPSKHELCKKLIECEDAASLQKITDISTAIHGEINSLYDLIFAFIECGRVRQARKILETPGLTTRDEKINFLCERYVSEKSDQPLENLIEATKDLSLINRIDIFNHLLKVYIAKKDLAKANGLWLRLQEEDVLVNDQFLYLLGTFLKENDQEVPFSIPSNFTSSSKASYSSARNDKEIRKALKNNEFESLRNNWSHQFDQMSFHTKSEVVELFCRHNDLALANEMLLKMLSNKIVPIYRVLEFYMNKAAFSGMVAECENLSPFLDSASKKRVSFDNKICNSYTTAGRSEEYLRKLEKSIDDENADLGELSESFPRGGIIGLLEKNPGLVEKYKEIAEKYHSKGIHIAMNCLWNFYFISEDFESAQQIFEQYLKRSEKLMFMGILKQAGQKNSEQMFEELLKSVSSMSLPISAVSVIYSHYLQMLHNVGNFDKISQIIDKLKTSIGTEYLNKKILASIEDSASNSGIDVSLEDSRADRSQQSASSSAA